MRKIGIVLSGILGVIALAYGIFTNFIHSDKISKSVSIIGGADGPTSIFLAGKVGSDFSIVAIVAGIVLLIITLVFFLKRK